MIKSYVKQFYRNPEKYLNQKVSISGWVRTVRDSKTFGFIELNDGSFFKGVQVVFEDGRVDNFKEVADRKSVV